MKYKISLEITCGKAIWNVFPLAVLLAVSLRNPELVYGYKFFLFLIGTAVSLPALKQTLCEHHTELYIDDLLIKLSSPEAAVQINWNDGPLIEIRNFVGWLLPRLILLQVRLGETRIMFRLSDLTEAEQKQISRLLALKPKFVESCR